MNTPTICPMLTPTGKRRRFSSVFKQEDPLVPEWRIASSGVRGWPLKAENTAAIASALRSNGITVREYSMGSPANMDSYHLEAKFFDGGLKASTGKYWYGRKGAWITGHEAIAFVAEILDLILPPVMRVDRSDG